MKKLLFKNKKILAILVLMFTVVCTAAPAVQAVPNMTKHGDRHYTSGRGYRSHTKVTGHENGIAMQMTAGASMGYDWYPGYGKPTAEVYSQYVGFAGNAYHAYSLGGGEINLATQWTAN
jgi:hypothetical protein